MIPVTRMSELSTGAQLIVWATRHVVGAAVRDSGVPWCVQRSFEIAGAVSAYGSLQSLLVEIAQRTPRQIVVARPASGVLTQDEVAFAAALVGDGPVEPAEGRDRVFGDATAGFVEQLREAMEVAGLPLCRLGVPDPAYQSAGRSPALHANPGLAGLH